jgi:hypothetical protein
MKSDPRYIALCSGLRQLTVSQLYKLYFHLADNGAVVLDDCNFKDGVYCPLAIAVGLDKFVKTPSEAIVYSILTLAGLKINNTRGVAGEFYTVERRRDLEIAVDDVLIEKVQELDEKYEAERNLKCA